MSNPELQPPGILEPTVDDISRIEVTEAVMEDMDAAGTAIDPIRLYLHEIGRRPLLTAEQVTDLSKRIEAGLYAGELVTNNDALSTLQNYSMADLKLLEADGVVAKRHLTEANLRLVVSISKKYVGRGMDFLDLIQEGNVGLIRAVEKFDYQKGFKFSTYATWWIRQVITRSMAEQARTIRVPVHVNEQINKINGVSRRLVVSLGRNPTDEELAAETDLTVPKMKEIISLGRTPLSLQALVGEDSEMGDFIEDADALDPLDYILAQDVKSRLEQVIASLSERESIVLRARFGLDGQKSQSLDTVGRKLGLTRERIRQIEAKALSKLRHPSRSGTLSTLTNGT